MNPKIPKLRDELEKNKKRINFLQEKNRKIEKRLVELENTDIIGMVRAHGMTLEQFMELFQAPEGAPVILKAEEEPHEES